MTDNIVLNLVGDLTAGTYQYQNLGTATFRGVEGEGKYYVTPRLFLVGSALYQRNEDGNGNTDITPIANFSAKMGVSFQSRTGVSASVFDTYQDRIAGYDHAINPKPESFHNVNAHARFDVSSLVAPRGPMGVALVVHANNLVNRELWLPDWKDTPGDTIFAGRGRSVYVGADVTFGRD
jgi:outer membrane receptor protein involved in Fe transport